MAPLVIWLTPASLLSKQEDYRTIEIKQRAKYDGEPGNSQGLSLMGLLNPFWWIMHELAWSCQPSWSASSYGSSDPNKEGTAVASWLLPQQASCLTSVFEKPYWSWAGIPWNGLLPATSSFVNPSWQSPNTGSKAFLWLRDPRNGLLYYTREINSHCFEPVIKVYQTLEEPSECVLKKLSGPKHIASWCWPQNITLPSKGINSILSWGQTGMTMAPRQRFR